MMLGAGGRLRIYGSVYVSASVSVYVYVYVHVYVYECV